MVSKRPDRRAHHDLSAALLDALEPGDTLFAEDDHGRVRVAIEFNPLAPALHEALEHFRAGRRIDLARLGVRHGVADLAALENAVDDEIDTELLAEARRDYRAGETVALEDVVGSTDAETVSFGYKVRTGRAVADAILRLPAQVKRTIAAKIAELRADPRHVEALALLGEVITFRIRVGDYCVAYKVREAERLVLLLRVSHRSDIYR